MEILTPFENGHYHFIAIIDGHAFRQINLTATSLVYLDNNLIAKVIDGEYIFDGDNYGWMTFEDFVNLYGAMHQNTKTD